MTESIQAALREGLEWAFLLSLVAGYLGREAGREEASLYAGAALAAAFGASLSFIPSLAGALSSEAAWRAARYLCEAGVFTLGMVAMVAPWRPRRAWLPTLLFLFGASLTLFEARSLGIFVHGQSELTGETGRVAGAAAGGLAVGLGLFVFLRGYILALPARKALTLPSLLMAVGAFLFAFGGVREMDEGNVLVSLGRGMQLFLEGAIDALQLRLLIPAHRFLDVPWDGLADYLSGDRAATTALVLLVVTPPVYYLIELFSRPDPDVRDLVIAAERRLRIAFFRRELIYKAAPVLLSFLVILVALHALNAATNPMDEPAYIPVRSSEEEPGVLRLPLTDRMGSMTDQKLRKYVYYGEAGKVMFLAIMKPDGTLGVALDECEICKPAEWNTSAWGYAQMGRNLICKYCMTPIPVPTVNKPGGCNPIPIPFGMDEGGAVVAIEDLMRVWAETRKLDKKGTHL
jgi:hypothetical protein